MTEFTIKASPKKVKIENPDKTSKSNRIKIYLLNINNHSIPIIIKKVEGGIATMIKTYSEQVETSISIISFEHYKQDQETNQLIPVQIFIKGFRIFAYMKKEYVANLFLSVL